MAPQYIRIVAIPSGEAPLWVREKWLGLCLPVADDRGSRKAYVSGVLSGPRNRFIAFAWRFLGKLSRQSGYAVYVRDAVSELEKTAPDAAAWWKNDGSRLQVPGRKFLFRASYCELTQPGWKTSNQRLPVPPAISKPPAGRAFSGTTNPNAPGSSAQLAPSLPLRSGAPPCLGLVWLALELEASHPPRATGTGSRQPRRLEPGTLPTIPEPTYTGPCTCGLLGIVQSSISIRTPSTI